MKTMKTDKRILLVAGGTGGHIWPAIAFGKWIEANKPNVRVDYICGNRALEKEIYNAAECEPFVLQMAGSPLAGSLSEKLKRTKAIFTAFKEVRAIIKRTSPNFILLFGGYISFPVLIAARMAKVPVAVQEQNAYSGKVTRLAARLKIPVYSGWDECKPLVDSKYKRTSVPVRKFRLIKQEDAWKKLGFEEDMPTGNKAVVFSGSLGSTPVKELICGLAEKEEFKGWNFILPAVVDAKEKIGSNVYLLPKMWNPETLFSLADMAVVRAGGSTLTEVGTLGIASLIIPWDKAADNHQYHNAIAFMSENASIIWDGKDEKELERKLHKLEKLAESKEQITSSKLYNNADRISATLWAAISSSC